MEIFNANTLKSYSMGDINDAMVLIWVICKRWKDAAMIFKEIMIHYLKNGILEAVHLLYVFRVLKTIHGI